MLTLATIGGKWLVNGGKFCTTCCGRCPTQAETEDGTSLPRPLNITVAGFCASCSCQALNFGPQQITDSGASTAPVWDAGNGWGEYNGVNIGVPYPATHYSTGSLNLYCNSGVWTLSVAMNWVDSALSHDGNASFTGTLVGQSGIDPRGTYDGAWTITVIHGAAGDCTDTGVTVTIT